MYISNMFIISFSTILGLDAISRSHEHVTKVLTQPFDRSHSLLKLILVNYFETFFLKKKY